MAKKIGTTKAMMITVLKEQSNGKPINVLLLPMQKDSTFTLTSINEDEMNELKTLQYHKYIEMKECSL